MHCKGLNKQCEEFPSVTNTTLNLDFLRSHFIPSRWKITLTKADATRVNFEKVARTQPCHDSVNSLVRGWYKERHCNTHTHTHTHTYTIVIASVDCRIPSWFRALSRMNALLGCTRSYFRWRWLVLSFWLKRLAGNVKGPRKIGNCYARTSARDSPGVCVYFCAQLTRKRHFDPCLNFPRICLKRAAEIRRFEVRFRELAESFLLLVEVRVPMVVDREEKKNIYIYIYI